MNYKTKMIHDSVEVIVYPVNLEAVLSVPLHNDWANSKNTDAKINTNLSQTM